MLLGDRTLLPVAESLYSVLPDIGHCRERTGDRIYISRILVGRAVQAQANLIANSKFTRFHYMSPKGQISNGAPIYNLVGDRSPMQNRTEQNQSVPHDVVER